MQLRLSQYEVMEALFAYINDQYKLEIDESRIEDFPVIEFQERNTVYLKNKNGSYKRKKNTLVVDCENSTCETKHIQLGWDATLEFYISENPQTNEVE
jgi:hypothetical protein